MPVFFTKRWDLHVHVKGVDEFSVKDIMDIAKTLYEIGKGPKFLIYAILENFLFVGKETRALAAKEITGKYIVAEAIVVNSTALKLLVNFYIAFNKPKRPTRMFDSEDKAVAWLKTFL